MIYIPRADAAIGNLSLMYATHLVMTKGEGVIHPDVYKYGRDKTLRFENVSDEGKVETHGFINGFTHLRIPNIGLIMSCLLYTSPSPRDKRQSRMPSSA